MCLLARLGTSARMVLRSLTALSGLAAIRPSRFCGWDEAARSDPSILRVAPAGVPAVAARRLVTAVHPPDPTWQNVLVLVAGAILAPGKRTVTAALRILGRERETDFPIYHTCPRA
jgi:hypothetical protein